MQERIKIFIEELKESGEAPYLNLTDPRVVKLISIVWREAYYDGFNDGQEKEYYSNRDPEEGNWAIGWRSIDGQD